MGSIADVIGGLLGSLFGPGSSISSNVVIPSGSGPAGLPNLASADLHGRDAAIAATNYTEGRVCKTTTVIHNGEVASKEDPPCEVAARRLTAQSSQSPLDSILGSILG